MRLKSGRIESRVLTKSEVRSQPTLVIACRDQATNWLILKQLRPLAIALRKWLKTAQIRIYPPPGEGTAMEIPVMEVPLA